MRRDWEIGASTLGAPGESLDEVIGTLTTAGAGWIELRAAADALIGTVLDVSERAAVRRRLDQSGLSVLSVASGVRVGCPGDDEHVVADLVEHVRLAADLGARFLRVFPGIPIRDVSSDQVPPTLSDRRSAEACAAERLSVAGHHAAALGVCIALETHDSNPRGVDLRRILDQVDPTTLPAVGVIWDLLHPWRVGEPLHETWQALAPFLRDGRGYVQIKDVASRRELTPVLQGDGSVPLDEALRILRVGGYRGPLSLEWERTGYPQVAPLAHALAAAAAVVRRDASR